MATRAARHIKKDVGPERALKGFQDPKAGKNIWNPNGRYAWGSLQADRESIRYRPSWKWQAT